MQLKGHPAVTKKVEVTVNAVEEATIFWIEGPDEVRLDR